MPPGGRTIGAELPHPDTAPADTDRASSARIIGHNLITKAMRTAIDCGCDTCAIWTVSLTEASPARPGDFDYAQGVTPSPHPLASDEA